MPAINRSLRNSAIQSHRWRSFVVASDRLQFQDPSAAGMERAKIGAGSYGAVYKVRSICAMRQCPPPSPTTEITAASHQAWLETDGRDVNVACKV